MRWIEDERLAIALGNQIEDDGNVLKIAAPEKLRCIAKRGEREGVQKVAELAPREPVHSESAATITRSRVVHSPTTHYIERFQPQGTKYTLPVRAGNADSLFDLAICECSPIVIAPKVRTERESVGILAKRREEESEIMVVLGTLCHRRSGFAY